MARDGTASARPAAVAPRSCSGEGYQAPPRKATGPLPPVQGRPVSRCANSQPRLASPRTLALEIVEGLPDLDAIIVPMGGGACASGIVVVMRAMLPKVRIIGVQAERAPALARSLAEGRLVTTETADTFAGGLATRFAFELPFELLKDQLDEIVLVTEEEMREAVREALETTHNVAEGATAAAYAAARKLRGQLSGKRVVIVHTGQNTDRNTLRWALGMFDA